MLVATERCAKAWRPSDAQRDAATAYVQELAIESDSEEEPAEQQEVQAQQERPAPLKSDLFEPESMFNPALQCFYKR